MKALKIIISIILCIAIGLCTYYAILYAQNGNHNFYVKYNNETIIGAKNITLESGKYNYFYPGAILSIKKLPKENYTVQVLCTSSSIFKYTVDGAPNITTDGMDITAGFEIIKDDGLTQIFIPKDTTFLTVLQKLYPDRTVELSDNKDMSETYFILVFSSLNEQHNVSIQFNW